MSATILKPVESNVDTERRRWMVEIYNNDHSSFQEVVSALMEGTGCGSDEAYMEAWEAHNFGKSPVHFGSEIECKEAARVINAVGVRTQVTQEWTD